MEQTATADLRYPVGKLSWPASVSAADREAYIKEIKAMPLKLRAAVEELEQPQLDTPYRPGGWTVRQVVHHLADSHLNSYTRFKLALTEDQPTIKPYDEARWAELPEAKTGPIEPSIILLDGLHHRWTLMLKAMTDADFQRSFIHPERQGPMRLDFTLAMYAWHCRHHVAHITSLRQRMGWK